MLSQLISRSPGHQDISTHKDIEVILFDPAITELKYASVLQTLKLVLTSHPSKRCGIQDFSMKALIRLSEWLIAIEQQNNNNNKMEDLLRMDLSFGCVASLVASSTLLLAGPNRTTTTTTTTTLTNPSNLVSIVTLVCEAFLPRGFPDTAFGLFLHAHLTRVVKEISSHKQNIVMSSFVWDLVGKVPQCGLNSGRGAKRVKVSSSDVRNVDLTPEEISRLHLNEAMDDDLDVFEDTTGA
eukprot:PhF_6_TR28031/c0_g2_i1/m.41437